ncbi:MAG: ribosome biogenesis GTPase Der, partial [Proteobacteria bacterium]|nr:ribosome biogenesis GTPase Der [Pseudomonadota bacterium]
ISASHGDRVHSLIEYALEEKIDFQDEDEDEVSQQKDPCIAIVGKPNVGKSTLVNAFLGEERVVVFDQPGTTRDSVFIPFEHKDKNYTLVDTAGVRRRGRIDDMLEKFSVIKTLRAIDVANVVVLVIDGSEGVTDQDASLAGYILERGRAVVVVVNKWDKVKKDDRQDVIDEMGRRLPFMSFARSHYISALKKQGLSAVLKSVNQAYSAAMQDISTSAINEVLEKAVEKTPPPLSKGRRIKLKFGHQGGKNPPTFILHGNQVTALPAHYRRYLVNTFRQAFKLMGTPLRIELKQGKNPFEGRKPSKAEIEKRDRRRRAARRRS